MPELPEVETTRLGISPFVIGRTVCGVRVRQPRLRWPVPVNLTSRLLGQRVEHVERRAKYLLLRCTAGCVIVHLGMSGSLRVVPDGTPPAKHDHIDIVMDSGNCLRLRDPRRFGAVLWTGGDPARHRLLRNLGPEPLTETFDGSWLHRQSRGRGIAVKAFIMQSKVVVGVGNIYASEALHLAGVHPARAAGRISIGRYDTLAESIKAVLLSALDVGGTTLRDFVNSDGEPGYFGQRLRVYGRQGQTCDRCRQAIRQRVIAQRSSFYCASCQH